MMVELSALLHHVLQTTKQALPLVRVLVQVSVVEVEEEVEVGGGDVGGGGGGVGGGGGGGGNSGIGKVVCGGVPCTSYGSLLRKHLQCRG